MNRSNILAQASLLSYGTLMYLALGSVFGFAQVQHASSPVSAPSPPGKPTPVEQAIELAAKQRCKEALPLLNEHTAGITDKHLKYRALMATEHCAMRLGDGKGTVNALMALRHEFPKDPDVLYLTTQVFLDIAVHASRELADIAPDSYQVRELQAENLESQNKWEEAAAIYRKILEETPNVPAIHFRLGRAVLSEPETPATVEEARKEFEQEVTIDPSNGSAEFWMGEIARRQAQWEVAVPHFTAAMKLDPNLSEAMLALGMTFNSEEHFADAIGPLEQYTRTVPDDPAGHYQLALAYLRLGRKEDSAREKGLVEHLSEKPSGPNPAPTTATPH